MSRHASDERDEPDEQRHARQHREDRDSEDNADRRRQPHRERGVVLFADHSGSIIRAGDEALEDDLPVLNAFRQFLDAERRRARRQLLTLIAVFSVVLAGLAGGGFWFVRKSLHQVAAGIETEKIRYEEDRLATVSNLQNVAKVAVNLKKDVLETRSTSSQLQEKVKEQSGELTRLLDTITTLEIQNSTLQRSVLLLDKTRDEESAQAEQERFFMPAAPLRPAPVPGIGPVQPAAPPTGAVPESRLPALPDAPVPAWDRTADRTPGGVPFRLPLPKE
jgi:hypothetical protein